MDVTASRAAPPDSRSGAGVTARIGHGAIWDTVVGPGELTTEVRLERCPAGWQASFELHDPAVRDVAVMHRLVAPTLRDARTAVPQAISFLLGYPVEDAQ